MKRPEAPKRILVGRPDGNHRLCVTASDYDALQAYAVSLESKFRSEKFHSESLQIEIDKAKDKLASPAWRTMDDAPKDGTWVALWEPGRNEVVAGFFLVDDLWMINDYPCTPTHWQPLPAPPTKED